MSANPRETARRPGRRPATALLPPLAVAALLLAAAGGPVFAAGMVCGQECKNGSCAQTLCASAGSAGGYRHCSGGSQSWGGATHSCWCASWGQALAAGVPATPTGDGAGSVVSQVPAQITQPAVLAATLRAANPWVATLVSALEDGPRWVDAPARGLIHDSYFDAAAATLSHTPAVPFTGQVTSDGLGTAKIDIVVTGEITRLSRLVEHAAATSPAAIPPQQVHGSVSAGGLHGSLQVTAADGRTQTIQW